MNQPLTEEEKVVAFKKLFHDNYTTLVTIARRVLPKEDILVIDDIVQRTMRDAYMNLDMLLSHPDPEKWLLRTERDKIVEYTEKVQKEKKYRR